ncbi:phosphatase PAP2 family protein [Litchfieldia alkalitelluris]|uniref:phosphatase PAP2 family protein n=1 Tax=Litchfieldia alkalitelluris TaxID=304268 RepID=UPI0014731EBF|nr:phosphatase PAP2 family protein [Litchfieldia alkalitelluris]
MEIKTNPKKEVNKLFFIIIGLTVFVAGYTMFFLNELNSGEVIFVDKTIGALLSDIEINLVISFFTIFTDLGSKWGVISVLVISLFIIWWRYRDYLAMGILVIAAGGGDQLNKWLKAMVARDRPIIDPGIFAEGYSFPSGHAMVGIMFFGFLTYYMIIKSQSTFLKKLVGWIMGIIIFLIGISRIVLNAHYPTDVFGGFAIGLIMLLITVGIYEEVNKKLQKK